MKRISILMGIYNCEKYLCESIESIISQTYDNWELIMCDDGSKDNTLKIAKKYEKRYPKKIHVLKNKKNMGLNFTLNKCLEKATGYYIARQDGDDISLPDRFQKEVEFLEKNPEFSLVSSNMIFFDENGDWGKSHIYGEIKKENFIMGSPICHAPCMIKKEVLNKVGGYTVEKKLLRVEDYHLWFKLFMNNYKMFSLSETLYKMRDDINAYNRRTFKNRLNETRLKIWGFRKIKIPLRKYVYTLKPIITYFIPKKIYLRIHKKKLNNLNNDKIKVAQFVGSMNCGGTEKMLFNLFKNIDKKKYEFTFIENTKDKSWYDDEIEKLGGHIIRIQPMYTLGIKKYIKQLITIFKNENFNVVHSHVFLHSGIVMLAAKKAKIEKRISHSHSAMGKKDNSFFKTYIMRKTILKNSTNIVACSKEAGICLFGNSFLSKGIVLPNPIDLSAINSTNENISKSIIKKYKLNTNRELIIGHVGRLETVKNHKFILKILVKLKDNNFKFRMFFLGEGSLKEKIKKEIKNMGLTDNVIMTGNINNVYEYMKVFDLLLLPSKYEGLPVTLIEAQSCGLYSIVSKNISRESDLGLGLIEFLNIDDEKIWVKKIIKYKKKTIDKEKILKRVIERKYSPEISIKEYEKIYNY